MRKDIFSKIAVVGALSLLGFAACKKSSSSKSGGASVPSSVAGTWNFSMTQTTTSGGCGSPGATTSTGSVTLAQSGTSVTATVGTETIAGTYTSTGISSMVFTETSLGACGQGGGTGSCTFTSATTMTCTIDTSHCDDCVSGSDGIEEQAHATHETGTWTKQ